MTQKYYTTRSLATAAAAIEQGFELCMTIVNLAKDNFPEHLAYYNCFNPKGLAWRFPKTPHNMALMEVRCGDLAALNGSYIALGEYPIKSAIIIYRNNKPFPVWDKEGA